MALPLTLPALEANPANPPETRPEKVGAWLASLATRDPVEAAHAVADALSKLNRVAIPETRRFALAERCWSTAEELWPLLERRFAHGAQPLSGEALDAARMVSWLAQELSVAYKHLLAREADRRIMLGGSRQLPIIVQRCLQSVARTITCSYLAYSQVPAKTWLDAHRIYAFAFDRGLHELAISRDQPEDTLERLYMRVLLLALANPYGLAPGQLGTVLRYLDSHAHLAKLTDVQPVHRMAKAVAIVPIGHDFPPFSASKGGAIEGRKMFLLTYDLAFALQEHLRNLDAGGLMPPGLARDAASRRAYVALMKRLLRQWAIPPARQFNRVSAKAPVMTCAGLAEIWKYSRATLDRAAGRDAILPRMTRCEVINHTPAGYALRQTDARSAVLRIGDVIAIAIAGRGALQVAIVRWFRNTPQGNALEFGCELLCELPEPAKAKAEDARDGTSIPVLVLPQVAQKAEAAQPHVIVPADTFRVEQAIKLERAGSIGFAVLTKLVEQGPGFEMYDYIAVA